MKSATRRLLAALLGCALLGARPGAAEVVDRIAIERHDTGARIHVLLTVPVRYVRHSPAERGQLVVVVLEALPSEGVRPISPIEEVKRARGNEGVPPFAVRVSLDPTCNPATPRPVCLVLRFERPVRYRIALGPDSRSIVVDVLPQKRAP